MSAFASDSLKHAAHGDREATYRNDERQPHEALRIHEEEKQVHAHLHTHEDGTVHNHYHSHPGGAAPHTHHGGHSHVDGEGQTIPLNGHHEALRAEGVSYGYASSSTLIFRDITLQARSGKVLGILGNNGAGKSTMLNLLAGITKPSAGRVLIGEKDLACMARREVACHVAYVAQQQRTPHLSVYNQVLLGRKPHITWSLSDYDRMVVSRTIEQLGLEDFTDKYLDELSGGERQKVCIARALAQEPEVLLLDEPTSALDPKNQIEVMKVIQRITREESIATVLVIHDINLALRFCDEFLLVRSGEVVAQGDASVVTDKALTRTYGIPFTVDLLAGFPVALPLG